MVWRLINNELTLSPTWGLKWISALKHADNQGNHIMNLHLQGALVITYTRKISIFHCSENIGSQMISQVPPHWVPMANGSLPYFSSSTSVPHRFPLYKPTGPRQIAVWREYNNSWIWMKHWSHCMLDGEIPFLWASASRWMWTCCYTGLYRGKHITASDLCCSEANLLSSKVKVRNAKTFVRSLSVVSLLLVEFFSWEHTVHGCYSC
jgi:hypothetical protein